MKFKSKKQTYTFGIYSVGGNIIHTLKANYYKMGVANLLQRERNGLRA
jgi:hypothetical protein